MDSTVLAMQNNNLPTKNYVPTQRYCTEPNVEIGESKTNLIINYLPQGMSQEEVRALFASIGEVESCKLVRDKISGQSLGYGFVEFKDPMHAQKAVLSFNGLRLQNKTIKVSYARPSSDTIRGSNLYVSGIPKSMTLNELEGIFRPYGQIITSRILSDPVTGLSKGVGFVRFDRKNEAEIAIEKLNGTIPSSCTEQITVKFANNPATNTAKSVLQELEAVQQVAAAQSLIPFTLLAGAPAAAAPIRTAIGPIHHAPLTAKYRYSPLTGITAMPGMATAAIAPQPTAADYFTSNALLMSQLGALSDVSAASFPLAPTSLTAAYATPIATTTSPDAQGFTVMISNLAPEADDTLLWQLFAPFGSVISIKIARDISNKCKGYAFISYASYAEALTAINALNGTQLGCRTLQVTLKTAAAAPQLGAAIIR